MPKNGRPHHPAFPSEACATSMPIGMTLGRSSDLQAAYLLRLPSRILSMAGPESDQCLNWSVRSCLPLRGSSGFAPDSLFR